jgi:general secretion pathway protein M
MSAAAAWKRQWAGRWQATPPATQRALALGGTALGLLLVWLVAVQPAWRNVRELPAQIDAIDAQLQGMRALAAETTRLRGVAPVPQAQAVAALQAATERLGAKGRLSIQGDRAILTLIGADTEALRSWLELARSAARARPVEAQLSRGPAGYTGTLVLTIGGAA